MNDNKEPITEYQITECDFRIINRFISAIQTKQRSINDLNELIQEEISEIIIREGLPRNMVLDRKGDKYYLVRIDVMQKKVIEQNMSSPEQSTNDKKPESSKNKN